MHWRWNAGGWSRKLAALERTAAETKSPRIAVIDMGEVSEKSLLGKSYKAELEKLRDEIEAARKKTEVELGKVDAALKALQEEIQKQGQVLSPEALEKKNQEFTRKSRERQATMMPKQHGERTSGIMPMCWR